MVHIAYINGSDDQVIQISAECFSIKLNSINFNSNHSKVQCGVPQCSILGPLLFILHVIKRDGNCIQCFVHPHLVFLFYTSVFLSTNVQIDRILSQRTSQLRITVEHGQSSDPVPDVCGIFSRSSSEESNSPSSSNEPEFPSINNNVKASLSDCSPSSGERGRLGVFNYERRHMKLDRHGSAPKV